MIIKMAIGELPFEQILRSCPGAPDKYLCKLSLVVIAIVPTIKIGGMTFGVPQLLHNFLQHMCLDPCPLL
jgi:hypothetical protein